MPPHRDPSLLWLALITGGIAVSFALGPARSQGATRLVPEEFPTIQSAIDASAVGDTVLIGPGTYRGTGNREIRLRGRDMVVRSRMGPEQTVIDCENAGRGFYLSQHETRAARIEGLTVQNGNTSDRGGGIYCSPSSPTIVNCRILNCSAFEGGGMALPVFMGVVDRCVISGNRATRYHGGGILFSWAAFQEAEIKNCLISGNSADRGAGVLFDSTGPNRLTNCTITANTGSGAGGGIYAINPVYLDRCIVWGNCSSSGADEIRCPTAEITCSDIDTTGVTIPGGAVYENCIYTDPMFCQAAPCGLHSDGGWSLDAASGCLPANSPCGEQIGALTVGCGSLPATGACCFTDGTCFVMEQIQCIHELGVYVGDGIACEPSPCQPTPVKSTTWGRIRASCR